MSFHSVRFPTKVSLGAVIAPQRRTEIVTLGSGHEERNSRWADSRRSYNAGWGVKTLDDLYEVLDFFEERRGQLYGFLWKDSLDYKSCLPSKTPAFDDQILGMGDGTSDTFALGKRYGQDHAPWFRAITKPVQGSVIVAVDGVIKQENTDFTLDYQTGILTFLADFLPALGQTVSAGFAFYVPVRFDTDRLEINMAHFQAGQIPDIPVIEIRV